MENKLRIIAGTIQLREKTVDGKESRTLVGRAIAFDSPSQDLGGFIEYIDRSAVTEEWLATQDVKLNMLHDRSLTIGRSNKGEGNLKIEVREDGVWFEITLEDCDICNRALAMVRSGVFTGCSFEFWPKDYTIKEEGDTTVVRHTAFERLGALTIGMDPAYPATSVSCRELIEDDKQKREDEEAKRKAEEERKQREAEQEARRRRAAYYRSFGY